MYGTRAWEARNGFTAAQGVVNLLESVGYGWYGWVVWRCGHGRQGGGEGGAREGRGAPGRGKVGWWGEARVVRGPGVAGAVLVGFAASVMTVGKTVLYCESGLFFIQSRPASGEEAWVEMEGWEAGGKWATWDGGLILYGGKGLNEYFSGFDNIGHNSPMALLFLWIIPK